MRALGKEASDLHATCVDEAESLWDNLWSGRTREEQPVREARRWETGLMAQLIFISAIVLGLRSDLEALSERVDKLADIVEGRA